MPPTRNEIVMNPNQIKNARSNRLPRNPASQQYRPTKKDPTTSTLNHTQINSSTVFTTPT